MSRLPEPSTAGWSFAGFRLEPDGTLYRGKAVVHLPPKELAALGVLLAHAGQIVTAQQLRNELWGDAHVTADSVPKCISSLRARLEPEDCIQTVYKRGYRLSAVVRRHEALAAVTLPRLAIVAFESGFGFPEHLGPAAVDGIAGRLANMRPPLVSLLAGDSVATLSRRGFTAQQIGRTLDADLVLKGTLYSLPAQFRLRAEMIRVEDGTQVWVEDMLSEKGRIAGLEEELVQRLLFRLAIEPRPELEQRVHTDARKAAPGLHGGSLSISAVAESSTDESDAARQHEAFDVYLRARHEWQSLQRHAMQDALHDLLRAIELDPQLTSARVELAHLCVAQSFFGFMSPAVAAGHVRGSAGAIPHDVAKAEAILPALGWVRFHVDHDLPAALRDFSQCSHLPHDPMITHLRVMLALSRHRFDEALEFERDALRDDPYSPWLDARMAWTLHLAGRAAESVAHIEKSLAEFPGNDAVDLFGAAILAFNGQADRAVELGQRLEQRSPHFDLAGAVHAYALACAGRTDEARGILERLQWLGRERFVNLSFMPALHLALGDREAAIDALRCAERIRCPWLFQMLADPRLAALHGEPRFEQLLATLARMEEDASRQPDATD